MTPCFDYHTTDNVSYCALASLCSILESCNNTTGTCESNRSVCVSNSCCTPNQVCLPLLWTMLRSSSSNTDNITTHDQALTFQQQQ
ncbi:unnamed protein product [Rotaria sp. Silwood2]|nr:unnamed protein product [Rotaria sp. Silwood2]CAF2990378.1 unnamed protein product [Rotaria sp. Silwood2]CAF3379166.1 unnamed protein product [Rotaria sp. Silwood2]CAF4183920.1 unnamed protein product [Rotaria sp. Silwood2]CAF4340445.1 unnamed protein product [Rotaria sp. Silwood2]